MKFSPICKFFLMMLCTGEQEICALHAVCERSYWLCTDLMFSAFRPYWQGV